MQVARLEAPTDAICPIHPTPVPKELIGCRRIEL
jgi:hypothetical protein